VSQNRLEVADVVREHQQEFLAQWGHTVSPQQHKALRDIGACRTPALGGHVELCDQCGHCVIAYDSCRNRHCPKCQFSARQKWLTERAKELLPAPYFHLVFTLPHELAPLALQNQKVIYNLLFRAVSETLLEIAADPKHLGVRIGFLAVLHTWGQNLHHHPHIHCVVPGGGISLDRSHWISCRNNFFLPVRVLSRLFRGKFLAFLREAHEQGQLSFFGTCAHLREPSAFQRFAKQLKKSEWVVYSKPPFGGPEQVLKYLSRYTHRVAISNSRLLSLDEGQVSFHWRDYRDDQIKVMTISAVEFLRRFLQHVLPPGFVKIRHFGWLANRCRKVNLAECRRLLSTVAITTAAAEPVPDHVCPLCHIGVLRIVGWLAVAYLPQATPPQPIPLDSS
jgi:Putative transposase/Transposase zinc-binding domain